MKKGKRTDNTYSFKKKQWRLSIHQAQEIIFCTLQLVKFTYPQETSIPCLVQDVHKEPPGRVEINKIIKRS